MHMATHHAARSTSTIDRSPGLEPEELRGDATSPLVSAAVPGRGAGLPADAQTRWCAAFAQGLPGGFSCWAWMDGMLFGSAHLWCAL